MIGIILLPSPNMDEIRLPDPYFSRLFEKYPNTEVLNLSVRKIKDKTFEVTISKSGRQSE